MVTNGLLLHCTPHATAFVNTDAADTPTKQTDDLSTSPLRKPVCWESTCGWEMFEWVQMKGNAQRGTKLRPVLDALPVSAMAFQLSNQQQGGTSRAWHLLRRPRAFAVCSPRLTLKNILLFLTFYSTLTAVQWREAKCFCTSERETVTSSQSQVQTPSGDVTGEQLHKFSQSAVDAENKQVDWQREARPSPPTNTNTETIQISFCDSLNEQTSTR